MCMPLVHVGRLRRRRISDCATLLCLYSNENGSRWKIYIVWRETHNEYDPILHSRTEDLVDSTPVSSSMLTTYTIINWLMLPEYFLLQNFWQYFDLAPTSLTGSSPPRFWSLIGSRKLISCTIRDLVVTPPQILVRWLAWCRWSYPSPPYMVTSLPGLICSRNFTISSWMRLTSMVLPPLNWKTCSRSNTPPLNRCSLINNFMIPQVLPQW